MHEYYQLAFKSLYTRSLLDSANFWAENNSMILLALQILNSWFQRDSFSWKIAFLTLFKTNCHVIKPTELQGNFSFL